jgi:hypothetical protein
MTRNAYDAFWDELPNRLDPARQADPYTGWMRLVDILCEFIGEASHPEDLAKWLNEHYPKREDV